MWSTYRLVRSLHRPNVKSMVFHSTLTRSRQYFPKTSVARSEFLSRSILPTQLQICNFGVTQRRDVPPALALILRPLLRIGALFFGRKFKKWWAKKSPEEREAVLEWFRRKKNTFYGIFGTVATGLLLYYLMHIETDPLTNRSRFIMFNKEQQAALAKITFEMHLEEHKEHLLPRHHPAYAKLLKLTNRLLNANKDLPAVKDQHWTLTVVDLPLKNAYVLPGGNIFVFMGALDMVENDDQLSIIIGHEMAHALLKHSIEQASHGILVDILLALPIALIWAFFPDFIAMTLHIFGQSLIDVVHSLPYSRALEKEADEVGLTLAAKACVDVREAAVFWATMRTLTELDAEPKDLPWLSTHPNHGDREKHLNTQTPKAIVTRDHHKCPVLDPVDPRKKFYERSLKEHEMRFKQRGII